MISVLKEHPDYEEVLIDDTNEKAIDILNLHEHSTETMIFVRSGIFGAKIWLTYFVFETNPVLRGRFNMGKMVCAVSDSLDISMTVKLKGKHTVPDLEFMASQFRLLISMAG